MDREHKLRVKTELREAGVTSYGMMKFSIKYIPEIIDNDEHIKGVIYGRYADDTGSIKLNTGVMVATDKRIYFLDHKPGYTRIDEIDYRIVSGVNSTTALFSSVTIFSTMKNYSLRFVNKICATKFEQYVESRLKKA